MAPREEEKAMEGLLRRNLARGTGPAEVCPAPDILAAYFERSLDADEVVRHELHFSQCARCREQLAAMARADESVGTGAEMTPASSGRAWFWNWRWLAIPATAMLAFAIVGFLWMRAGKETARQLATAAPVALAKPEAAPTEDLEVRQDQKQQLPLAGRDKNPVGAASPSVPPSAPRMMMRNVVPPKSSASRQGGEGVAAKTQATDAAGRALDKPAPQRPPMAYAAGKAKVEAPGSASETVEVSSAAPAVLAPAAPPVSEGEASGAGAGVPGGAAGGVKESGRNTVMPASRDANAQEAQASTLRKKLEKQTQGAAVQAEVARTSSDITQLMTVEGQPPTKLILTPDPAILWRFAGSGFVERSTDGGATWQGEEPSQGGQVLAGAAPSADVCWLVGRDGLILVTKDAKSWKKIAPPVDADFVAVSAENAPNATVTAADGRKFATRNGGKKWKPAE